MKKLRDLRANLAFQYLSLVCSILIIVQIGLGLIYVQNDFQTSLQRLHTRIENQARFLSAVSPENLLNLNFLMLEQLMQQTSQDPDVLYSAIQDSNGRLLTRFIDLENSTIAAIANQQGGEEALSAQNLPKLMWAIDQQSQARVVNAPIISNDTPLGTVKIAYSITNVQQRFYSSAIAILTITLTVAVGLVAITTTLFNNKVSRPIKRLVVFAKTLASGDFRTLQQTRVAHRQDEVGILTQSFYSMAAQLQETLDGLHEKNRSLAIANTELDRATKMKSQFLANMSHELRTPLNAVLGLSQALMRDVYGPLTDKQRSSLQRISDSGKHLLSLIQDILDLAKIESGKEELTMGNASISQICQTSLEIVRSLADIKDLELSVKLDLEDDLIELDERRIRQVFINLLGNAVKFTPTGGKISITINSSEKKDTLYISVSDSGIGIAEEDMDKLFDSFVQVDSSLSRSHEGTGLGLTLVRSIVEMHGGGITVESTLGEGSCFTVALPWRRSTSPSPSARLPQEPRHGKFSTIAFPSDYTLPQDIHSDNSDLSFKSYLILIAEDNANNIIMLGDYLEFKGYNLAFAKDGYEALELARKNKPSLILMDVHMPRMNGLEATKRLRAEPDTADVPIVALTALAMQGDRERCYQAGMDEYIIKPINLEDLSETINEIFTRRTQLREAVD